MIDIAVYLSHIVRGEWAGLCHKNCNRGEFYITRVTDFRVCGRNRDFGKDTKNLLTQSMNKPFSITQGIPIHCCSCVAQGEK